ncbi:hypothetical protein BGZ83_003314, partial [Gryganskiella cystojenkinii]
PLRFVGLLHVGNSFEEVSTYTPLTLSKTSPCRPQPHSRQTRPAAPQVETVQLAVYRNIARARKQHTSLRHLDLNKAQEFFEDECKRIIKTDIVKGITKLLPKYREVQDEQSRLAIVTKGYDKTKSDIARRSNNKTPPRGSVAVMTRRLEGFHEMEKNSILERSLTGRMRDSSGFSAAATFTRLVETTFDNIWQEQMTAALSVPANNHGNQPTNNQSSVNENASTPEYRTCELPLSRILRQEFTGADIELIHNLFRSSQENLSAHMDQINIGILKAYTEIYQGRLHPSGSVIESLDINTFLPAMFTIRDQELLANPNVNIVRTNIEFLKVITEACKTKDEATGDDTENRLEEDADGDATTDPKVKPKANRRAASKAVKHKEEAVERAIEQGKKMTQEEVAYSERVKGDIKQLFSQDCIQYLATRLVNVQEEEDDIGSAEAGPSIKIQRTNQGVKSKSSFLLDPIDSGNADAHDDFAIRRGKRQHEQNRVSSPTDGLSVMHPLWDKIVSKIQLPTADAPGACCPKALTRTRNELIRTIATNIRNITDCKVYYKLKDALIRYLLRVSLRPLGEQAYKDTIKKKVRDKQESIANKKKSLVSVTKAVRHKQCLLLAQLDQALETCDRTWSDTILILENPAVEVPDGGKKPRIERVGTVLDLLDANEKLLLDPRPEQD